MPTQILNKNHHRTHETRQRLLEAAEEVFVRDGYHGAQLADIASVAGRSKGALYGHFKSKEDLFLALFEYRSIQNIERMSKRIERSTSRKQMIEKFRDFFAELISDKNWPILTLEFKLFALRNPQSKERLRETIKIAIPIDDDEVFIRMYGRVSREKRTNIELSILALAPILSGLMLESNFEPDRMSDKALGRLLRTIFDALFSVSG